MNIQTYERALNDAVLMMEVHEGLEPRSALKQAASDCGIGWGDDMGAFVAWAEHELFGTPAPASFRTELTATGEQYVIPGCEKAPAKGGQLALW